MIGFNWRGAWAIYTKELMRAFRTAFQSILSPVLTTSLFILVFGSVMGSRINVPDGVEYGAFIIPGLLLLTLLGESTSNASFGIYMPKFTGTIYELLSAPVGVAETLIGFVGAAATKSLLLAAIILLTARIFVDYDIVHPIYAIFFIML
ncbi:MAG TPA: sugar ABC transporter permease, partial [Erythrobacter sp.]|nr:sugar ABC transporter permease [Erythrobacter sp.]